MYSAGEKVYEEVKKRFTYSPSVMLKTEHTTREKTKDFPLPLEIASDEWFGGERFDVDRTVLNDLDSFKVRPFKPIALRISKYVQTDVVEIGEVKALAAQVEGLRSELENTQKEVLKTDEKVRVEFKARLSEELEDIRSRVQGSMNFTHVQFQEAVHQVQAAYRTRCSNAIARFRGELQTMRDLKEKFATESATQQEEIAEFTKSKADYEATIAKLRVKVDDRKQQRIMNEQYQKEVQELNNEISRLSKQLWAQSRNVGTKKGGSKDTSRVPSPKGDRDYFAAPSHKQAISHDEISEAGPAAGQAVRSQQEREEHAKLQINYSKLEKRLQEKEKECVDLQRQNLEARVKTREQEREMQELHKRKQADHSVVGAKQLERVTEELTQMQKKWHEAEERFADQEKKTAALKAELDAKKAEEMPANDKRALDFGRLLRLLDKQPDAKALMEGLQIEFKQCFLKNKQLEQSLQQRELVGKRHEAVLQQLAKENEKLLERVQVLELQRSQSAKSDRALTVPPVVKLNEQEGEASRQATPLMSQLSSSRAATPKNATPKPSSSTDIHATSGGSASASKPSSNSASQEALAGRPGSRLLSRDSPRSPSHKATRDSATPSKDPKRASSVSSLRDVASPVGTRSNSSVAFREPSPPISPNHSNHRIGVA
eukprot:gnl/Hemi2/28790_TR9544_c0_g1_i1.p1 gnl/Hemi2/28790_TR9544_c0_g1~~gnl/Hemi2/28790_TR9544_c0_g1_i1.p1  ORF type:complete len:659 (+),score=198.15 gnl/Hemi2/28790_TR9544_c0_g1_i1:94-2070(+)